uniref:Regulatory protein zeste n=1 Tax=Stomoxys calcitrans TaxID=35570 RepID=A0A1I8Q7F6_STOCA
MENYNNKMFKRCVKKTSSEQFDLLKLEMSKHPAAAIGGYGSGTERSKVDAEWREIVEKLNAIGPPHRTMTEWKKVWSDVRLRIKKRLSEECSGTIRKKRKTKLIKTKQESESEEDYLMESLNDTNSLYASHSYDNNEGQQQHNEMEDIHEAYNQTPQVTYSHDDYKDTSSLSFLEDQHQSNSSAHDDDPARRSGKRTTTNAQFKLLRAEMITHPAAAMGYVAGTDRSKVDAEWKEIQQKLNAIGPPYRSLPEWKKVWSDVRLRIKRRLNEGGYTQKVRHRRSEIEAEEDHLMEALTNSIYAQRSSSDNRDYDEPEIDPNDPDNVINTADEDHNDNSYDDSEMQNNPLEEDEVQDRKTFHRQLGIFAQHPNESHNDRHINEVSSGNHIENTLYTLQSQMEQHNKLLQHLSKISTTMTSLMERHIAVMERRTQLMENQSKANALNDYLRRRQENRRKIRDKRSFEWF